MEKEKKKVALYIRVSTTGQVNDGYGLEAQKKELEKYCKVRDYQIYKLFCDAGVSGKDTKHRIQFNKMMADMRAKKFDMIIAIKLDRISRSMADFALLLEELEKNNCEIEFVDQPVNVNCIGGKLMAYILGAFSQFEREMIVERTLSGVEEAVHNGHFGGKPPLGYKAELINGKKTKKWVIDKEEAKIVKEIFDLCLKGKTYAHISNIMKEKYPNVIACYRINKDTNERKPIYRSWKDSSISVILNNKRYMGIHEHRKKSKKKETIEIEGKIPPIITKEDFYECQENIKRNSRNYYRNKNYLFMQKLICPKCGRVLACNGARNKNNKDYLYYKCKECNVFIREEWVEKALIGFLVDLLELYLVLEDNYYPIDSEIAEDFNKCRLDNKVRFAMDNIIIEDKKNMINYETLYPIWSLASYEAKCRFIFEYIDTIEIKKYSIHGEKEPRIKILGIKMKPNKIKKYLELKGKNMLDSIAYYKNTKFSIATLKSEKEALKYVDILSKKHKIKVINILAEEEYYHNDNLFKIIKVNPKKAIEKPRAIFLELDN